MGLVDELKKLPKEELRKELDGLNELLRLNNVVLVADKNSKAWNFAVKIRDYIDRVHNFEVDLREVQMGHFKNQETQIKLRETARRKDVYFIQDSTKNPNEWWTDLLLLNEQLHNSDVESVTLVLPDMYYSRQDRKPESGVPISSRAVAGTISVGLRRIITMDLHSPQIEGNYPSGVPLINLYSFPAVIAHLKQMMPVRDLENMVVVSPDVGGATRARAFAKRLGSRYPIAVADKSRIEAGEVDKMTLIGNVKGKNILAVDDIYDTCKTLIKCGKVLAKNKAKRKVVYSTHGLFTNPEKFEELKRTYDIVMTSDTHYREGDGLVIVEMAPTFGEAIYRAHIGKSISELFE